MLYLINDLLHHSKYHLNASSKSSVEAKALQTHLVELFALTSAQNLDKYPKHHKRIQELLNAWEQNAYYQVQFIAKLRGVVTEAATVGYRASDEGADIVNGHEEQVSSEQKKEAPYIMPAFHGDSLTPYYDLPAGNIVPHIIPNSATPVNPQFVKPLQLTAGPADERLVIAVEDFMRNVDSLDDIGFEDERMIIDVDELGQCVVRDEISGQILEGDGYYGWSRAFCEKMKEREHGFGKVLSGFGRDSSISRGSSPGRKFSDSGSSRAGNRSRSRSRSISVNSMQDRKHRRADSRSRLRSRSPPRPAEPYRSLRGYSHSLSRSPSYSPPPMISTIQQPLQSSDPRPLPRNLTQGLPLPQPYFPTHSSENFPPTGRGSLPVPPPPPPNYKGLWPPPPPPMSEGSYLGPSHSVPPANLPTGPKLYQNRGLPVFPQGSYAGSQNQTLQNQTSWGQPQQQQ